jgi:RHS repeat-associated protein
MTTIPKPANPTVGYTGIYDAWNRLTAVKEGGDFVAEYSYDAAKRRTIQKTYSSGVLSETRHSYYSRKWRGVEDRVDNSTSAERQFVWGQRYTDEIILRDRDTNCDGMPDERLYGLQDANWNLVSITDISGTPEERYSYTSYGASTVLTAAFAVRAATDFEWSIRFTGYHWSIANWLYFARNRVQDYSLGTWLTRDAREYYDDMSLYTFMRNNPIRYVDPLGLSVIARTDCVDLKCHEKMLDCMDAAEDAYEECLGDPLSTDEQCFNENILLLQNCKNGFKRCKEREKKLNEPRGWQKWCRYFCFYIG